MRAWRVAKASRATDLSGKGASIDGGRWNDVDVPAGALAAGSPAVIKPGRADIDLIRDSAAAYVDRIELYRTDLRRLD